MDFLSKQEFAFRYIELLCLCPASNLVFNQLEAERAPELHTAL
jgi:hypothetical protein